MSDDLRPILDEIKARADIVEIVSRVIELQKKGKDFWAPCPFHSDGDPSFSVVPAKQMFHCFGCGAQGDVFEFWSKFHNIKFWDAVKAVASLVGVKIPGRNWQSKEFMKYPERKKKTGWQPDSKDMPSDLWCEKAKKFVNYGMERLFEKQEAMDYLLSRGIKPETIVAYGLGWCEDGEGGDFYRPRASWGLPDEFKEDGKKKALWLPRGLIVPYMGVDGKILKIRIRRPDPLKFLPNIRYYFVPGGSAFTTVINPDRDAHIIIETDLDACLLAQEVGDLVGVVCVSSASSKPDERATAVLKNSRHILNALDFDNAGAQAWPWWRDNFPECERWPVPKGKDTGEAFQQGVNIREWVREGLPPGLR
jgi:hypothetical protein